MNLKDAILSDTISHLSNVAIRQSQEVSWDGIKGELINNPEGDKLMNRSHRHPYSV